MGMMLIVCSPVIQASGCGYPLTLSLTEHRPVGGILLKGTFV